MRNRKVAVFIFLSLLTIGIFIGAKQKSSLTNDTNIRKLEQTDLSAQALEAISKKNEAESSSFKKSPPKNTIPSLSSAPPIGTQTKMVDCVLRGPLPDLECTPGAVFEDATREIVCTFGYTKKIRNVSTKMRKRGYASYNIPYPQERGAYEFDHLIPLALGGNNDMANLFPEAAYPKPGFKEKDAVEMYLRQEVCEGRITIDFAQRLIADDWTVVYYSLSEKQIIELKNLWKGWAN